MDSRFGTAFALAQAGAIGALAFLVAERFAWIFEPEPRDVALGWQHPLLAALIVMTFFYLLHRIEKLERRTDVLSNSLDEAKLLIHELARRPTER
jgi:hypothetical protein